MDLSIIIVSYNTRDLLINCLKSISENTSDKLKYEIIIVDNGSKDDTVKRFKSYKQKDKSFGNNVKIIENNYNYGFAKGNNIGIKQAKGRFILFLNSDTKIIEKYTLEKMVSFMDGHKDAGASTCFVELPDGRLDDAAHRGFPTPWNALCHFSGIASLFPNSMLLNGYHLGYKDLDKLHAIDALAGAFMLVRRQAGDQVSWWDEDYFFYGEDLDFCYQLKEHGWKIYFVPDIKIIHYKGVSSGIKSISRNITKATKEEKAAITKARFDAMKIFYRKHYSDKYPWILTRLVMMGIKVREVMSKKW